MRSDVLLKLVRTFVVGSFWLVVDLAISEDSYYVFTKMLPIFVFIVRQLLLDSFQVDRLLHD